jgi:hypothetical protein
MNNKGDWWIAREERACEALTTGDKGSIRRLLMHPCDPFLLYGTLCWVLGFLDVEKFSWP